MGSKLDNTDVAYAAGFFDADGSVGVYPTKSKECRAGKAYCLTVQVTQKLWMPVFVQWQDHWGGHLYHYLAHPGSMAWRWTVKNNKARVFLEDILPYLGGKRDQAELAIEFQKRKTIPGQAGLSGRESEWQYVVSEAIKEMKRTSDDPPEAILLRLQGLRKVIPPQLMLWEGQPDDF